MDTPFGIGLAYASPVPGGILVSGTSTSVGAVAVGRREQPFTRVRQEIAGTEYPRGSYQARVAERVMEEGAAIERVDILSDIGERTITAYRILGEAVESYDIRFPSVPLPHPKAQKQAIELFGKTIGGTLMVPGQAAKTAVAARGMSEIAGHEFVTGRTPATTERQRASQSGVVSYFTRPETYVELAAGVVILGAVGVGASRGTAAARTIARKTFPETYTGQFKTTATVGGRTVVTESIELYPVESEGGTIKAFGLKQPAGESALITVPKGELTVTGQRVIPIGKEGIPIPFTERMVGEYKVSGGGTAFEYGKAQMDYYVGSQEMGLRGLETKTSGIVTAEIELSPLQRGQFQPATQKVTVKYPEVNRIVAGEEFVSPVGERSAMFRLIGEGGQELAKVKAAASLDNKLILAEWEAKVPGKGYGKQLAERVIEKFPEREVTGNQFTQQGRKSMATLMEKLGYVEAERGVYQPSGEPALRGKRPRMSADAAELNILYPDSQPQRGQFQPATQKVSINYLGDEFFIPGRERRIAYRNPNPTEPIPPTAGGLDINYPTIAQVDLLTAYSEPKLITKQVYRAQGEPTLPGRRNTLATPEVARVVGEPVRGATYEMKAIDVPIGEEIRMDVLGVSKGKPSSYSITSRRLAQTIEEGGISVSAFEFPEQTITQGGKRIRLSGEATVKEFGGGLGGKSPSLDVSLPPESGLQDVTVLGVLSKTSGRKTPRLRLSPEAPGMLTDAVRESGTSSSAGRGGGGTPSQRAAISETLSRGVESVLSDVMYEPPIGAYRSKGRFYEPVGGIVSYPRSRFGIAPEIGIALGGRGRQSDLTGVRQTEQGRQREFQPTPDTPVPPIEALIERPIPPGENFMQFTTTDITQIQIPKEPPPELFSTTMPPPPIPVFPGFGTGGLAFPPLGGGGGGGGRGSGVGEVNAKLLDSLSAELNLDFVPSRMRRRR